MKPLIGLPGIGLGPAAVLDVPEVGYSLPPHRRLLFVLRELWGPEASHSLALLYSRLLNRGFLVCWTNSNLLTFENYCIYVLNLLLFN